MPASCSKHTMDSLHPSFTPTPLFSNQHYALAQLPPPPPLLSSLSPIPHPAPMPSTSRRLQCNSNIERVLLYPVYVCYIVILFASLTEEATIKANTFYNYVFEKSLALHCLLWSNDCFITIPIYTLAVTQCSFNGNSKYRS